MLGKVGRDTHLPQQRPGSVVGESNVSPCVSNCAPCPPCDKTLLPAAGTGRIGPGHYDQDEREEVLNAQFVLMPVLGGQFFYLRTPRCQRPGLLL
jgi:hypothetical protein